MPVKSTQPVAVQRQFDELAAVTVQAIENCARLRSERDAALAEKAAAWAEGVEAVCPDASWTDYALNPYRAEAAK